MIDKRDALIHAGYGDASAILNVLHQAGWQITPREKTTTQTGLSELLEPVLAEFGAVIKDGDENRDTNLIFCARLGLDAVEVYECALRTFTLLSESHAPESALASTFLLGLTLGRALPR